ncbi:MAG: hypothetical protein ABSG20_04840 [Bradyrhizobium sp.]
MQVATSIDGATYTFTAAYDGNSRLTSVSFPSGFTVKYTNLGYANQMLDATSGAAYWTLNAMDAEAHILQQTSGNGLVTTRMAARSRPVSPMTRTATRRRASAGASSSPPTTSPPASRKVPAPSASSMTASTSATSRSGPRARRFTLAPSACWPRCRTRAR